MGWGEGPQFEGFEMSRSDGVMDLVREARRHAAHVVPVRRARSSGGMTGTASGILERRAMLKHFGLTSMSSKTSRSGLTEESTTCTVGGGSTVDGGTPRHQRRPSVRRHPSKSRTFEARRNWPEAMQHLRHVSDI